MKQSLIDTVLDWPSQQVDFEPDGSLREIYVQNTNTEDWHVVLARILECDFQARLSRGGVTVALPASVDELFAVDGGYWLCFRIAGVALDCHFFTSEEIEFSFGPEEVTATSLPHLLSFMIEIGDVTKKPVIMTPENWQQAPMFTYLPEQQQLKGVWLSC